MSLDFIDNGALLPTPPAPAASTAGVNDDLSHIVRGVRGFVHELAKLLNEVGALRVQNHNLTWDNAAVLNTLRAAAAELQTLTDTQQAQHTRLRAVEDRLAQMDARCAPAGPPVQEPSCDSAPLSAASSLPEGPSLYEEFYLQLYAALRATAREWYQEEHAEWRLDVLLHDPSGKKRVLTLSPAAAVYFGVLGALPVRTDAHCWSVLSDHDWRTLAAHWQLPCPVPVILSTEMVTTCVTSEHP